MSPVANVVPSDAKSLFFRLAPRDREVVSALIHYYWLNETDVAAQICMSPNNLRARRHTAYRVLGVESRHALIYVFRDIVEAPGRDK